MKSGTRASTDQVIPAQHQMSRVLVRLGLLSRAADLPAPFVARLGESEQSWTGFFYLESGRDRPERLLSVKKVGNQPALAELWSQIREGRKRTTEQPFLPVAPNEPGDGMLVYDDGRWAAQALRRMGMLGPAQPLPRPLEVFSGIAGLSRVYLFHLPDPGATGRGQVLLLKFDRPDRMRAEWEQIGLVRRQADLCREIVTPMQSNTERDGVMVYPAFQGQSLHGHVVQLDQFLGNQLLTNPLHVQEVLRLLGRFLQKLYLGGDERYDGGVWRASNEDLVVNLPAIRRIVAQHGWFPARELGAGKSRRNWTGDYPDPFESVESRLQSPTGRQLRARTHGDLQSTNVLVALGDFDKPEEIAVIDLEKYQDHRLVVEDLARIEADFWRSIFSAVASSSPGSRVRSDHLKVALTALVIALDRLDGRSPRYRSRNPRVLKLADAAGHFVFQLRQLSWSILRPRGSTTADPRAYFQALEFYYLKALSRRLVHADRLRYCIVVTAASLAEKTLRDLETAGYPVSQAFPTTWPPADLVATDVRSGTAHVTEKAGVAAAPARRRRVARKRGAAGPKVHQENTGPIGVQNNYFS